MKKIIWLSFLSLIGIHAGILCFICCVTEQDQINDIKEQLNIVKEIIIDSRICKTKTLSRYKARKEENITWHAQLCSPPPACINLSQARLGGVNDPKNHLIWYEWTIQAKNLGIAEIKLEQHKNEQLQRTQFVKVEVTD